MVTKNTGSPTALRKMAMALPQVHEAVACKGTALESAAYKCANNKTFLFVQPVGRGVKIRLKLDALLKEARQMAKAAPDQCKVGIGGWVALDLDAQRVVAPALLLRWIAESHLLVAGGARRVARKATPRSGKTAPKRARK